MIINKFEDINEFDDNYQEIRSDEGKQDQNRLEDWTKSKRKCVEEEKEKYNYDKGNKHQRNKAHNQNKKNKKNWEDNSIKLEEVK